MGKMDPQSNHAPVCWLALDAADNDPARFLGYLLMAFDRVHPGITADARAMLDSFQVPAPQLILTVLMNTLQEFVSPIILVQRKACWMIRCTLQQKRKQPVLR
jgi:LuxR family maltose regulon positive regulatory protein